MAVTLEFTGDIQHQPASLSEMAAEHGIRRLSLTGEGAELATDNPEAIQEFIKSTQLAERREIGPKTHTWMGHGKISHVYSLAVDEKSCIKISHAGTQKLGNHTGSGGSPIGIPSSIAEAKLMNGIRKRLAQSDAGVHTPRIYAAAKCRTAQTMMLEKVPDSLISGRQALEILGEQPVGDIKEYEKIIKARVMSAVGLHPVRLGIGDLTGEMNALNKGNIFLSDPEDPHNTEIFVIDLMGVRKCKIASAALFGTLS